MNENGQPTPLKILLADDDSNFRFLASKALEKAGFIVTSAEDGSKAVDTFKRDKPDIVLLDIKMPDVDGITACSTIRQLPGGDCIPILMITGMDDIESIDQAYEAGATDFITKPINWLILGFRVRFMLRANRDAIEMIRNELQAQSQLNPMTNPVIQFGDVCTIDTAILDNIRELEKEMDTTLLNNIIQHFFDQAPPLIQSLYKTIKKRDKSIALTDIAKLKSQSFSLGAMKLASMCKELESILRADIHSDVENIVCDMEDEFECVKQALSKEF